MLEKKWLGQPSCIHPQHDALGLVIPLVRGDLQMVSKHQPAKHQDYVAAIGTIALEVADLELELSILLARTLMAAPKIGESVYMTAKGDCARLDIELATDCVIALIQQH